MIECGIFERTHKRPRPHQPDDQKLRKSTTLLSREAPMRLQVMSEDSDGDDVDSPSSTVPQQLTPPIGVFQHNSAPLLTASSLDTRRYPFPTPVTTIGAHGHGHTHDGASSPYGYAYSQHHQKRAATFGGAIAAPASTKAPGGDSNPGRMPGWQTMNRHNEIVVHDSQGSE
ncbi:hypothetical protein BCR39DRAFT_380380 [Naematelia encephala]|uniref:Uncharacterized protein n=1 Tax=Naematelia encephala TaxID=71784 RepID=A0A1Y2BD44_9TREE|nr:hypothetical protein BCR39DRAFT_380380 [Naematelia encephala]